MYEFLTSPQVYDFLKGPMVWISFIVFIGGSIYRISSLLSKAKKVKVVSEYMSLKYTSAFNPSLDHPFCQYEYEKTSVVYRCGLSFPWLFNPYSAGSSCT